MGLALLLLLALLMRVAQVHAFYSLNTSLSSVPDTILYIYSTTNHTYNYPLGSVAVYVPPHVQIDTATPYVLSYTASFLYIAAAPQLQRRVLFNQLTVSNNIVSYNGKQWLVALRPNDVYQFIVDQQCTTIYHWDATTGSLFAEAHPIVICGDQLQAIVSPAEFGDADGAYADFKLWTAAPLSPDEYSYIYANASDLFVPNACQVTPTPCADCVYSSNALPECGTPATCDLADAGPDCNCVAPLYSTTYGTGPQWDVAGATCDGDCTGGALVNTTCTLYTLDTSVVTNTNGNAAFTMAFWAELSSVAALPLVLWQDTGVELSIASDGSLQWIEGSVTTASIDGVIASNRSYHIVVSNNLPDRITEQPVQLLALNIWEYETRDAAAPTAHKVWPLGAVAATSYTYAGAVTFGSDATLSLWALQYYNTALAWSDQLALDTRSVSSGNALWITTTDTPQGHWPMQTSLQDVTFPDPALTFSSGSATLFSTHRTPGPLGTFNSTSSAALQVHGFWSTSDIHMNGDVPYVVPGVFSTWLYYDHVVVNKTSLYRGSSNDGTWYNEVYLDASGIAAESSSVVTGMVGPFITHLDYAFQLGHYYRTMYVSDGSTDACLYVWDFTSNGYSNGDATYVCYPLVLTAPTGGGACAGDCSATTGATCRAVNDPTYTTITYTCMKALDASTPAPWFRMLLDGEYTDDPAYSDQSTYLNDIPMMQVPDTVSGVFFVYAQSPLVDARGPPSAAYSPMTYRQLNIGGDVGTVNGLFVSGALAEQHCNVDGMPYCHEGLIPYHTFEPASDPFTASVWFIADGTGDGAETIVADAVDLVFTSDLGTLQIAGAAPTTTALVINHNVHHMVWTGDDTQACVLLYSYDITTGLLVTGYPKYECNPQGGSVNPDASLDAFGNNGIMATPGYYGNFNCDIMVWDFIVWQQELTETQMGSLYSTAPGGSGGGGGSAPVTPAVFFETGNVVLGGGSLPIWDAMLYNAVPSGWATAGYSRQRRLMSTPSPYTLSLLFSYVDPALLGNVSSCLLPSDNGCLGCQEVNGVNYTCSGCAAGRDLPFCTLSTGGNVTLPDNPCDATPDICNSNQLVCVNPSNQTYLCVPTTCSLNPCMNNGTCLQLNSNQYACACPSGFAGNRCESPEPCADGTGCNGHGNCSSVINSVTNNWDVTCDCETDYYGDQCEIPNPCINTNPCLNNGVCIAAYNSSSSTWVASCDCSMTGFGGSTCDSPNPCGVASSHYCSNGGSCSAAYNATEAAWDTQCTCVFPWGGDLCTLWSDPCSYNTSCPEQATCSGSAVNSTDYTCTCNDFYSGPNCDPQCNAGNDTNIDTASCTCINGFYSSTYGTNTQFALANATCDLWCNPDGGNVIDASCVCDVAHLGDTCDVPVCNGASTLFLDSTNCSCTPPFYSVAHGLESQYGVTRPGCESACYNGNVTFADGMYGCSCADGWQGYQCDQWVDPCGASPCLNDGTCSSAFGASGYFCVCPYGYNGLNCSTQINACLLGNPCSNGGMCNQAGTNYSCTCPIGFVDAACNVLSITLVTSTDMSLLPNSTDEFYIAQALVDLGIAGNATLVDYDHHTITVYLNSTSPVVTTQIIAANIASNAYSTTTYARYLLDAYVTGTKVASATTPAASSSPPLSVLEQALIGACGGLVLVLLAVLWYTSWWQGGFADWPELDDHEKEF